ncbi:hypothetical protein FISHEDRAFT_12865, partial [Fistulina hepatica ATCC 64428]
THVNLPQHLPFPVTVVSIDAAPHSEVRRGTRLMTYSFMYVPLDGEPEMRFGTWESAIDGEIQQWNVKKGDVISQNIAKARPVVVIHEPCKHGMQLGGLCVLCGKDMTVQDYLGFSDTSRAHIQMTHSADGPTVSFEEAQRIERETAVQLIQARKLSLIVDLDQTIVHATVDPTVGEWIAEGEAWEAKRAEATDDASVEECNPNWEALKDVKKFRLSPESFGIPSSNAKDKARGRALENEGCLYYIKPRPGTATFLQRMAAKYEMHVYTMGTRAYAEEVCAIIDSDGRAFGGRILSRDESGSMTQKSLQRLFPCDQSMVVIIDDRSDVWEWSPNLIKVVPYDFFVGIGDINSAFLPKIQPLTLAKLPNPSPIKKPPDLPDDEPTTPEETEKAQQETKAMLARNTKALEAQVDERPLAKKQEQLQPDKAGEAPDSVKPEKLPRKALLKNDDNELVRVEKLLNDVHARFFAEYDKQQTVASKKSRTRKASITHIIPQMRASVLRGVTILFSSVIPLDTVPENTEVWKTAFMFGARCVTELSGQVTHVVAAKPGTVKVDAARKRGGIKIVWLAWFLDSIALWERQDERTYLLDDPGATVSSPVMNTSQMGSSDAELDFDSEDWELEGSETESVAATAVAGGVPQLQLDDIDWNDINDEVDAAMNESDDND